MNKNSFNIVKVIWKDAKCLNSNLTLDEIKKEELIITETFGSLIDESKERIAVSSTIFIESNGELTYRDSINS